MKQTTFSETEIPQRRIVRPRIHNAVVSYLINDIQKGLYKVGESLPSERKLMASFGVGRSAIRESMATLERMGLVEIRPGMSTRVRKPTVKPLLAEMSETLQLYMQAPERRAELTEFRMLFESMIVRELARRIDDAQLARLARSLDEQKAALGDSAKFTRLDLEFHAYLCDFLNNPLVATFAASVFDWLVDQRVQSLKHEHQFERALAAHVAIYEGLLAHDADRAEKALREHLKEVQVAYESILANQ